MSALRYLRALFDGCERGRVECRSLPSGEREFAPVGDWRRLGPFVTAQVRQRQNVTIGVSTRADASSGTAENLEALPAAFVDFDGPLAELRRRLDRFPFTPGLVVGSGGDGAHGYWLFKEPLDMRSAPERERAASILRRLAHALGADPKATDVARVLRLPATLNFKRGTPRPVEILDLSPARVNPSELEDWLPPDPGGRRSALDLSNPVQVGFRNDQLFLLIRTLQAKGLPLPVIADTARTVNARHCTIPLPEAELMTLLRHTASYRNRPDFRGQAPVIVHDVRRPP